MISEHRFGAVRLTSFSAGLLVLCLMTSLTASAQSFALTGSMHTARSAHSATLLNNGQVLVAGGEGNAGILSSAELYDPATGIWTVTGSMTTPREAHSATLLPSGQVLVAGGLVASGSVTATAELYDPSTGKWTATGSMSNARDGQGVALLPSGEVLVAGGVGTAGALRSAELYDPSSGVWTKTGSLNAARSTAATLLADGEVLMAGGSGRTAEIYSNGTWTYTSQMVNSHGGMREASLDTGNALAYGGTNLSSYAGEVYNPSTNVWTEAHNLGVRPPSGPLTALNNGDVLLCGGVDSYHDFNPNGYLYVASSNAWTGGAARMKVVRSAHAATLLQSGDVLISGGSNTSGLLNSAEIFTP
jgi:N-acetylneuraminic acid mutarotase